MKTELANKKGIKLIQIFEDEYFSRKDIVLSKIKRLINCDKNLVKVMARKCQVKEIEKKKQKHF